MKIDATRYSMYWSNPERFRLRELWRLAPVEPKAGTFASLLTYGRRRGSCFHEIIDGRFKGLETHCTVQELRDGGFGDKEITAALRMAAVVKDPDETLAHEVTFEYPIPDTDHIMTGRVDSIIREFDEVLVLDYKTSKHRSKTDCSYKLDEYCRGPQVGFYLLGARALGFEPKGFIYRLVVDGKTGVQVLDRRTERTGLQLAEFARGVGMTCDQIEFMKERHGIERPWPMLSSHFDSDYFSIAGTRQYDGIIPDGYVPKREHLETMPAFEPEAV